MAKKGKTDKALATTADRTSTAVTDGPATVTDHDVARRAYELYLAREREHGHDLDDWLQSERELAPRPLAPQP